MKKLDPNATILLVEDDPGDVFLMKRALKKAEIPNPTSSGRRRPRSDKLSVWSQSIFRPISISHSGHCFPGFEVLTWIRTQPQLDPTVVMVLTSSSEERDIAECSRLGAYKFLVKPPMPEMLTELMSF